MGIHHNNVDFSLVMRSFTQEINLLIAQGKNKEALGAFGVMVRIACNLNLEARWVREIFKILEKLPEGYLTAELLFQLADDRERKLIASCRASVHARRDSPYHELKPMFG